MPLRAPTSAALLLLPLAPLLALLLGPGESTTWCGRAVYLGSELAHVAGAGGGWGWDSTTDSTCFLFFSPQSPRLPWRSDPPRRR